MSNKVNSSNLTTVVTVQSPGPRGPQGLKGLPGNITGSVTDIHAGGDITASGNISASGTIIANNFQSSGGNVDGISFTDDLNITGDITASGNISASGNLFAHSGSFMYITASKLEVDDSTIVIGGAEFTSASIRDIDKGTLNSRRDGTVRPGFLDSSQIRALTGGTILDTDTFIRLSVADEVRIDAGGVQYWNSDQDNATFTIGDDSTTYPLIIQTPTTMSRDLKVSGSLLVVTNITASNISASGTVLANKFQSTGGDVGGISFVDDLNITGDITASGNISSSGNILTSGNITALGTITAEQITSTDDMTAAGNLGVAGQINLATDIVHTLDPDTKIAFETDKITLAAGGVNMITLTEAATDQIEFANARTKFAGHITASGNISASGTVFASKFESAGASSETIAFNDNLNVTGNITASGNISASGDIIATEITGSSGLFTGTLRVDSGVNFNHTLGVDGTTIFEGDVQAAQNIMHLNDTDTKMEFGTDKITFTAGNKTFLILDGNTLPNAVSIGQTGCFTRISGSGLEVDTPITASGNISASGIITAEGLVISDDATITDDLTVSGQIELGHASDTSLTRASSGDVNIEGNIIYRAGGTDVPVADGGTGVGTLTDGGVLLGNGTGAIQAMAVLTDGQMIVGDGTTDPVAESGATLRTSIGVGATNNVIFNHITASGNISSSGAIQSTGNISTDGAINATSADFGDGNIANVGVIDLDTIRGDGDTNTNIAFTTDQITFKAGNEVLLTLQEGDASGRDIVTIGDGGDVDFKVRANGDDNAIFVQGSSDNVGIGTTVPSKKLTVTGDISASGDIFVGESILSSSGNYLGNRQFNKTSTTDADHSGDIVYIGGTTSMDAGKIYAYGNNGAWNLSDADHNNLSGSGLLGVALGAASDINGMLLRGTVTLDHDPGAVGDVLYLSTTAGQATSTVPSGNTDIARVVGYCLDASNGQIWFNPDNTFVEVSA